MGNVNIVEQIMSLVGLLVLVFFAYRIYQKLSEKPKLWKVFVIIMVGLFAFTFNISMFGIMVKIPVLPLGVWILYAIFRKKEEQWQVYRRFAWLGFVMNFVFVITTLVAVPINQMMYPENEPASYISTIHDASIVHIHPSAEKSSLNKEILLKEIGRLKEEPVRSHEWYNETDMYDPDKEVIERFPYQLVGFKPKWGSGLNTIVYIEKDGKGLLIQKINFIFGRNTR
ncbi:hypothetical protein [Paenisporosarcina sp. TG20]|uniref:hypothetical protein n=1 Tax=Paenisporosarcina sp. TG20 TaxID=1211706 RepID=UPI00031F457F|nr:hypothetical protein [Paenisporosarcina sp. TG20]